MQPAARNEAFGDFGLPTRRPAILRALLIACAFGAILFVVAAQLVTQWLARALAYQSALGDPVTIIRDIPLFVPWAAFRWKAELGTVANGALLARQTTSWLALGALLSLCFALLVFVRRLRDGRNRAAELHGSARWAVREEIERASLFAATGIIVGKWVDKVAGKVRYLRHNGPEHVLVFAPTGSGKGVGLVLPTLLTWPESAVVLDPKGENHGKTSGWRQSQGQRVFKLDFAAHPSETAAFNPLSAVRLGAMQETADVQRIARMIVDPDGKQFEGASKHWAETASSLLTGALMHVLYRERLKGRRATLADVVDELSDKHRNHSQVLLDWLAFAHDPNFTQGWQDDGAPTATHPVIAASAREQLNREEKERGAVLSSSVTPLALFRDPLLAANTSRSDFTIEDIMDGDKPVTIYLVLSSDDMERLRPIVRIIFDLMLRRLMPPMPFLGGEAVSPHRHRLLLLLDEFPTLGKLKIFTESLAYMRGWGIKAKIICQDYEQLRAEYGDRETISSNCQIQLAFAPNKFETAKHLSQMTGIATILKRSRSKSLSLGAFASNRNSESEQEVSRPLLTPDECMRLPGPVKRGKDIIRPGDMLIFFAGSAPIYGQQPLYFKDPTLQARSRLHPATPRPVASPDTPVRSHQAGATPSRQAPEARLPDTAANAAALIASVARATPVRDDLPSLVRSGDLTAYGALEDASEVPAAQPPQAPRVRTIATTATKGEGPYQQAELLHTGAHADGPDSALIADSGAHIETIETTLAEATLAEACLTPFRSPTHGAEAIAPIIHRLNEALRGHKVKLEADVDPAIAELGPRFLRAYVLLQPGESIASIRRCSEDLARAIGTTTTDIHIANVPSKHAVGLDLPVPNLAYEITFEELAQHPSFGVAQRCLGLGFCAGIDVSGRPVWADLNDMPHLLVAGTTGSGKTVFLRNIILTLLLARTSAQLRVRLSSSKPNDFRVFMDAPHAVDRDLARDASEAKNLALELVVEMESRYALLSDHRADTLQDFNLANRSAALPRIVAIFDEYAEMRAGFQDPTERAVFDNAISRLAQKARAAGIHLILCMQRPDSKAIDGSIKANVLHRVALKLPQGSDSRVILDTSGAETLLGQGDLFYKDAAGTIARLQVPALTASAAARFVAELSTTLRTAPPAARDATLPPPAATAQKRPPAFHTLADFDLDAELMALGAGDSRDSEPGSEDDDPFNDDPDEPSYPSADRDPQEEDLE